MILRTLTIDDIPAMLAHFQSVGQEAGWIPRLAFDPQHIAQNLATFIVRDEFLAIGCAPTEDEPVCAFLIAELGQPWYTPTVIANERVFYVHPNFRRTGCARQMIQRYIDWADERGAAEKLIGNGLGIVPEGVKALCESLGFEAIGYILKRI